jgi:two-component system nitrogen regulation sensor histidine kinase NtrY
LENIQNTYLSVGRFIDPQIIAQIQNVNDESMIYKKLYEQRNNIQINFYMVFILISLLILLISILIGLLFADALIAPITNLIRTSNQIKSGNLSVKVPQISTKDEMSLLIKTFNEMTKKLRLQKTELQKRERNAAWLDIARRIAHEIKNPLTPIQLSAEYLKSKSKNKEDKSYADTIIKKVSSIENMVDEFSRFAKLPKPQFSIIKLNKLCYDLILFYKKSNKKINFSFSNLDKDFFVKIDEYQISMVISNLIQNSMESINEYNSKNKRINGKINLSIYLKNNNVYIKIDDNGGGLPKSFPNNKILEPYVTTKKKGTGLGLAIVQKIIQEHNGNFFINDKKNGTSALVELPKKKKY